MELLTAISERLGIETYLEESQFGLLKTTLAIAGKRFVLDVEIEADSTTSGDGDDQDQELDIDTPAPTPGASKTGNIIPPLPQAQLQQSGVEGNEQRGKVRLAKLLVNHITKNGATASSVFIAHAIRQGLEAYLEYWNTEEGVEGKEEVGEGVIKRIWEDMGDLASLDTMSEESGTDWFSELEERAQLIERMSKVYVSPAIIPLLVDPC